MSWLLSGSLVEAGLPKAKQQSQLESRDAALFGYEESYLDEEDAYSLFSSHDTPVLSSGECRTYPGDEAWPSQSDWNTFNDELGGALIPTIPVAAPCYNDWGVYDEEECAAVTANFSDPYFQ